ncbi:MAG: hypothetical protein KatS3mg009_1731 [Acidimicrobiia bacterium]|nr:MAG: hypothetical protein KatS3mg009_1731 [Acidimicrobiia bacterium]
MGTFRRAFALTRASWSVLRRDKELVALPLLAGFACLLTAVPCIAVIASVDARAVDDPGADWPYAFAVVVLAAGLYLWCAYVFVFCNVALLCAADERLRGGDPTLHSALRGAASRAFAILPWAILSATVSLVFAVIRERAGIVGRVLVTLGIVWSLVTFLVLPVLVFERTGVRAALRRSTELFRRTWGDAAVASGGMCVLAVVASLAGAVAIGPFVLAGGRAAVLGLALFGLWATVAACVGASLSGILQLACYRYAVDGTVPGFGDELIQAAFSRRGRGAGAR